jgi:integrase
MEVMNMMQRVRRGGSKRPARKKAALETDIQAMLGTVNSQSARGLRNRALLLLGFAIGFGRSDLVALDIEDLEFTERGLEVHFTRSRADQEPQLREIWIPHVPGSTNCPVRALRDWLTAVGNKNGPVFRRMHTNDKVGATRLSAHSVALIVKEHAGRAGLDPDLFSGHSLRRGFLTSAAKKGTSLQKLAQQSGHRSWEMLRQYFEKTD